MAVERAKAKQASVPERRPPTAAVQARAAAVGARPTQVLQHRLGNQSTAALISSKTVLRADAKAAPSARESRSPLGALANASAPHTAAEPQVATKAMPNVRAGEDAPTVKVGGPSAEGRSVAPKVAAKSRSSTAPGSAAPAEPAAVGGEGGGARTGLGGGSAAPAEHAQRVAPKPDKVEGQSKLTLGAGGAADAGGKALPSAALGGGASVKLQMAEPPGGPSPATLARIAGVQQRAGAAVAANAELPSAALQVGTARQAVDQPELEAKAQAQSELITLLGERPAPSPEIEKLSARIREVIRNKRPPDQDALMQAKPEAEALDAGNQLNATVEAETKRVQDNYGAIDQAPAAAAPAKGQALPEQPDAVPSPEVNARVAKPDPVPADSVSLDADAQASRQKAKDAGMDTPAAQLVQTGPLAEARGAQAELDQVAKEDPAKVLAAQQETLANAEANMSALQEQALASLTRSRSAAAKRASTQQHGMVSSEELKRTQASSNAQRIFDDTHRQVTALLKPLASNALDKWEAAKTLLVTQFKSDLAIVQTRVEERHAGLGGAFVGLWDALTGLPRWAEDAYTKAEHNFAEGVISKITEISVEVNTVIATCELLIKTAREEIAKVFSNLGGGLADWAAQEQAKFEVQLDTLQKQALATRDDFNKNLLERSTQTVEEVRTEISDLRKKAGGLVGLIVSTIRRFSEDPVKFLIEGLLELLGIPPAAFWAVVAKIRKVVKEIADDPLKFASNLLQGLADGFGRFFDNFGTHMLKGFLTWLLGDLKDVQIPKDVSVKSIVTFFLQLMGITWPNIRKILAKLVGEKNVALLEKIYSLVSMLIEQGPAGIYEMIKEKLNPQSIVDQVVQMAVDYMISAIIKQVTVRIIALFNPVGAILQALEAIYRVLKWIFQNAARIFTLVETVVNGIADILAGNLGGFASAVEKALAMLIPPVLAFLADYLSLGDLPQVVAAKVKSMREWILGLIEEALAWVIAKGKALLAAVGIGKKEKAGKKEGTEQVGERVPFGDEGESHTLFVQVAGRDATLMVASAPLTAAAWLRQKEKQLPELGSAEEQKPARDAISEADGLIAKTDMEADQVAAANAAAAGSQGESVSAPASGPDLNAGLMNDQEALATALQNVLAAFGAGKPSGKWAAEIAKADTNAIPLITEVLDADAKKYLKSKEWPTVLDVLKSVAPVATMLEKPLLLEHSFGGAAHVNQALPAVTRAIASLGDDAPDKTAEDAVSGYKAQLHARMPPFSGSADALAGQVFSASQKPSATTTLQSEFREKLTNVEQEEHKRFKPQNLRETKVDGSRIAIDYSTEDGSVFHVTFGKDGMVESITGTRLVLKGVGEPRGVLSDAGRKTPSQGLDSSHLIADRFGGSGYADSANLIAASANYNRVLMLGVEDQIAEWIEDKKIATFSMEVKVTWGDVAGPRAIAAIEAQHPEYAAPKKRKKLEKDLALFLSENSRNLKRCMSTRYVVTSEADPKLSRVFLLGADADMGLL